MQHIKNNLKNVLWNEKNLRIIIMRLQIKSEKEITESFENEFMQDVLKIRDKPIKKKLKFS